MKATQWFDYFCIDKLCVNCHRQHIKLYCHYVNCALLCGSSDNDGDTLNLALVQYLFSDGEHKLLTAPHSNSRYGQLYVHTMPSVMCKIKEEARKAMHKRALQFLSSQAGGILHATSAGALPQNRQQVKDARRRCTDKQAYDHPLCSYAYVQGGRRQRRREIH